ncbi:transposase [Aquimarina sp. 2201CG1-2-11]|uniref:transposase n=1 Tax=Aquimarina discodermiae TaxID=3231043 RepID=UPI003461D77E
MLKDLDRQVFTDRFTITEDCYKFLAELKWENGYNCRRCNSTAYTKGKQPCSRRCSKCG